MPRHIITLNSDVHNEKQPVYYITNRAQLYYFRKPEGNTREKKQNKKKLKTNFMKMTEEVLKGERKKALKEIKGKTNKKLKKMSKSLP